MYPPLLVCPSALNAADRAMKSAGPGCERGSMRRWHPHAGRVVGAVAAMFVSILLGGCASYQDEPVAAERVASGWRNPAALSPRDDFDAYVAQVTEELRHHRLPFDASRAEAELRAVAPFKITPDQRCETDIPRGIAILIHGLSLTRRLLCGISRQRSQNSVLKRVHCCCRGMGRVRQI